MTVPYQTRWPVDHDKTSQLFIGVPHVGFRPGLSRDPLVVGQDNS